MARYFLGLISGTSMDGIDAAVVDLEAPTPRLLGTHCHPYDSALQQRLRELISGDSYSLETIITADVQVGMAFGEAANALLRETGLTARQIEAIGSHGQTVFHLPAAAHATSWQLGDPNRIAELTDITVVADLRRRDMAAGGEGAPLVPAFHQAILDSPKAPRVVLNIGGIANITRLPGPTGDAVIGFDTGPGNALMDGWVQQHLALDYDRDGEWADSGSVHPGLLERLLNDPYFTRPIPKSTGREYFNGEWLRARLQPFPGLAPRDVQATLCELTARSIADAIAEHAGGAEELLVCGGGVHNRCLMRRLAELLPESNVRSTAEVGVDPDWVEAMAFAWLAKRTLAGEPGNVPSVTGARRPVVLGGIYPTGAAGDK